MRVSSALKQMTLDEKVGNWCNTRGLSSGPDASNLKYDELTAKGSWDRC